MGDPSIPFERARLRFEEGSRLRASFAYTRSVTKLVLDPAKSRVRLHTFAEGLFSRLAHDLELECHGIEGTGERRGDGSGSASIRLPIGRIEVAGALKGGRVDSHALSPSDREEILRKMRKDVFQ